MIAALDQHLLIAFAGWARSTPGVIEALKAASFMGNTATRLAIAGLVAIGLLLIGRRSAASFLALSAVGAWAISPLVKQIVARPRPTILPWLDSVNDYSFPSSHALNGVAVYGAIALIVGGLVPSARTAIYGAAAILILAIGLSRIALGVHWPSDVMAGWCLGIAWILLCAKILQRTDRGIT